MPHLIRRQLIAGLLVTLCCSLALADDRSDKQKLKIQDMRHEVLKALYAEEPGAEAIIADAAGFGVFSNVGVNIFFVSGAGGRGVVRDNESGRDVYMRMASAGVGIGIGIKDFRGVFVFHTREALDRFIEHGWDLSGQTDAAAKSDDKGGEHSAAASLGDGTTVYQLTKNGLALQATLQGTKYWRDKKLNAP